MKKLILALFTIAPFGAEATVSGVFSCQSKVMSAVKANGRTVRQTTYSSSTIAFNPDGTITGSTPSSPYISHGTWSQFGRAIFTSPDINDAARDAIYGCSLTGASCVFIGATANGKGTANKTENVIKGTSKVNLSMLVNGVLMNSNATSTFTCRK